MSKQGVDAIYAFAFRGDLVQDAISRTEARSLHAQDDISVYERSLAVGLLDSEHVAAARRMAVVYTAISAFENSVRDLISNTLLEEVGASWWDDCASEKVQKTAKIRHEDEERHRYHAQRGDKMINYTDLGNLVSIIQRNWVHFEDLIGDFEWMKQILQSLERSRNVIMHSGILDKEDVERVGVNLRDWVRQVGT